MALSLAGQIDESESVIVAAVLTQKRKANRGPSSEAGERSAPLVTSNDASDRTPTKSRTKAALSASIHRSGVERS